ncbi:MAG: hypothetical protein RMM58_14135 [Chloroflexota bacterium]|nr:hypothetical protein [Dehalococcoidia bacterium]MDW8255012.1 hypothetical protein [Chloroflexota bacterium]
MSEAQFTAAQWQSLAVSTWLLFLLVLLGGLGAFSLAAAIIVIPSFEATQARAERKNPVLARLFRLRPVFLVGAVALLTGAFVAVVVAVMTYYPAVLPFWPRVWI